MPQIIPLTNDASQTQNIVGFDILVQWNTFDNAWRLQLSQDTVVIIADVKMICGVFLLLPYQLGLGDFYVLQNNTVALNDPGREDFSNGAYNLVYYTQDEMNAIFA